MDPTFYFPFATAIAAATGTFPISNSIQRKGENASHMRLSKKPRTFTQIWLSVGGLIIFRENSHKPGTLMEKEAAV